MDDNGHDEGSQVQEVVWELVFCRCVRLSKARSYQFEWILDTHLHLHPQYHIGRVLREFGRRLSAQRNTAPGAVLGGVFTEMRGGYSWEQLCAAEIPGLDGLEIVPVDDGTISFSVSDATIYLFRGAQIVTREGIEVLALLPMGHVSEGDDLQSTIHSIVQLRGVPVLPWSPGKWWGKRGRLVREVLSHDPRVWVGDISLRWWGRWQPIAVRRLEDAPARVLYGSDPLPIAGGEVVAGELRARQNYSSRSSR